MARLVATQFLAWAATRLLVIPFAPRLLLLEDAVVEGTKPLAVWGMVVTLGIVVAATVLTTRKARPLLAALGVGATRVDPAQVIALYGVPARLVTIDLLGTLVFGVATLLSPLRPSSNDPYTQFELVLLSMTM